MSEDLLKGVRPADGSLDCNLSSGRGRWDASGPSYVDLAGRFSRAELEAIAEHILKVRQGIVFDAALRTIRELEEEESEARKRGDA
jgi:hypothetical protein